MIKKLQPRGSSQMAIRNRERRERLFDDAEGVCFYCGDRVFGEGCSVPRNWLFIRPNEKLMVEEHRTPRIRDGDNGRDNIECACSECNNRKGNFTVPEFRFWTGLRNGDLDFRFASELPCPVSRDWLVCHSADHERELVTHNIPSAHDAYALRSPAGRTGKRPTK